MEQRFSSMQLDALREVSNIGVGNAATSLSTLLGTKIDMSVPSVNMVELSSIINESGENAVLGIVVRVLGEIPGNILILFKEDMAKEIITYLLGTPQDELTEMGASVLCEVGNILSASYMNAISQFTGLEVIPSVPAVSYDMMSAILATTFMEAGQYDEYILDIETVFIREKDKDIGADIGSHFYYIPVPGSLEKILKSLGIN